MEQERCVHCGQGLTEPTPEHLPSERTLDHVFPKGWYPETTPNNVQRWTVPSCRQCNNTYGNQERELFVRLALCVDPRKAEASGLSAKAVRSMGIGAEGITFGERERRKALKRRIIRAMKRHEPGTETFPGLGPHPGFPAHEQMEIGVPENLLVDVAKKIVRGCEYALANRIVEAPYEVGIYFVHEKDVEGQTARVFESRSAKTTHLGPGFVVTRAEAQDEPNAAMYKIVVWGTIVIYASIIRSDDPVNTRSPNR
jgi:hypothetical protein